MNARHVSALIIGMGIPLAAGSLRGNSLYEYPNVAKWSSIVLLLFVGYLIGYETKK